MATGVAVSVLVWWVEAQGKWSEVARMPTARDSLAAGVVDGKLYALGGRGGGEDGALDTVEMYDPVTKTWTALAPMPTARYGLAAGVVDGKLYAVGGRNNGTNLATVERYDPATDRWTALAPMPTARTRLAVVVRKNMLYALGGSIGDNLKPGKPRWYGDATTTVERYDPITTGKWWTAPALSTARMGHSAVNLLDTIYVLGGRDSNGEPVDTVDKTFCYSGDGARCPDTFRDADLLPIPRRYQHSHMAAGVLTYAGSDDDGKIYCVGTEDRVAVLDPWSSGVRPASSTFSQGTWGGLGGRVAPIPTPRHGSHSGGLAVGVVDNKLYALGGSDSEGNPLDTVEVYDPPFLRTSADIVIIILAAVGGVALLASVAAAIVIKRRRALDRQQAARLTMARGSASPSLSSV